MNDTMGDPISVCWWWTPDCGYQHLAWNPSAVDLLHCPDGVAIPEKEVDE